jgi:hypothetical protein
MSTDTTPSTSTPAAPEKVYVKIPKAGPGQEYKAPKNYQHPLIDLLSKLAIIGLCISLPLAPALIFAFILGASELNRNSYLWVWVPMIVLTEVIAIFVAIGVGREAWGIAGSNGYGKRTR